jgi:hypothetical protein
MSEIHNTPKKTLSWTRIGQVYILATAAAPIDTDELIALLEGLSADRKANGRARCALQYSPSQAPNAAQRKLLKDRYEGEIDYERFALVASSALVRGALTALSWLMRKSQTKPFAPTDLKRAFEWLAELTPLDLQQAMQTLDASVQSVGYPPLRKAA